MYKCKDEVVPKVTRQKYYLKNNTPDHFREVTKGSIKAINFTYFSDSIMST